MASTALRSQPSDWTTPGGHVVVEGVTRVPLPVPVHGLAAVNVYVLEDGDGLTIVDAGWAAPETHAGLRQALAEGGFDLGDIRQVLATHAHHDHYAAAIQMRESWGVDVRLGRGERPSVRRFADVQAWVRGEAEEPPSPQVELLARSGARELAVAWLARHRRRRPTDLTPWGEPDSWLDDGDVIAYAGSSLEVEATPGHTRGHIVLRDVHRGLLFAGDHVLPHITPSIGFEQVPEPAPLRSYLASLRRTRERDDTLLLPAHGHVSRSVHTRVDELLAHHDQRLLQVHARVVAGDVTAFQVAGALRWTSAERSLTDLSIVDSCLAVIETRAHLELLVVDGALGRTDDDGVDHYRLP